MGRLGVGALTVLLPMAAAAAVHAPSLRAGFAYDDPVAVVDNPLVTGEAAWWEAFTRNFWGNRPGYEHLASWRPLTVLSLRLDHALGGGAPTPFHATNLLLHLLVVGAVAGLARRLALPAAAAGAVALVVAIHPVFAEAVAAVVGRADLLAGALAAGGLALWPRRSVAAAALLALALLAKETAAAAVGALALREVLDRRWRPAAALAGLGVAWYAARAAAVGWGAGPVPPADNPLAAASLGGRLAGALAVVGRYASWWAWPQPIAADYGRAVDLAGPGGLYAVIGGLVLPALAASAVEAWRRGREAILRGALVALVALGLLSNALVVLPTPLAGRLAWLPGLGLTLAAAGGVVAAGRSVRVGVVAAAALWLALAGPASRVQVRAWRDDRALFRTAVRLEPRSVRSRVNLARQLLRDGRLQRAEAHLRRALELVPDHGRALLNLAVVLDARGERDAAWRAAQRAVERAPRPGKALSNLCALALDHDRMSEAERVELCRRAREALPGRPEPAVHLARALDRAGRTGEADEAFERALRAHPRSRFALGHRVRFLKRHGRLAEAVELQRRLVERSPDDAEARRNLIALLLRLAERRAEAGRDEAACGAAREAARRAGDGARLAERVETFCPGGR